MKIRFGLTAILVSMVAAAYAAPAMSSAVCDVQGRATVDALRTAISTGNGRLLASLVSPPHGVQVRYYRGGRVVRYGAGSARLVFESKQRQDWGPDSCCGERVAGSFQKIVLPSLVKVLTTDAVIECHAAGDPINGGNYQASWPYPQMGYYSVRYPGTEANGNLDWQMWAVGIEQVGGKSYIAALERLESEP